MPQHDDLSLMGMQELDSTFSIFETSHLGRESSTPGTSTFEYSIDTIEPSNHTIIVERPLEKISKAAPFEGGYHAQFDGNRVGYTSPYSSVQRFVLSMAL